MSIDPSPSSHDIAKEAAGKKAAELVREGMLVGLGTGTTAAYFIKQLGLLCKNGLQISAVATSNKTHALAKSYDIPLIDIDQVLEIDLTVDGADEIDPEKRLIKGGGGALLREKIIAYMSKEVVIIADAAKKVEHLGHFPLPVEIAPFAFNATIYHLEKKDYKLKIRKFNNGDLFVTDNGNFIVDIKLAYPCINPEKENDIIKNIPGVIETGFFFQLAKRVLIGYSDGHTEFFDDEKYIES